MRMTKASLAAETTPRSRLTSLSVGLFPVALLMIAGTSTAATHGVRSTALPRAALTPAKLALALSRVSEPRVAAAPVGTSAEVSARHATGARLWSLSQPATVPQPALRPIPDGRFGLESVDLGLRLERPWAAQIFAGVGMASLASFSYLETQLPSGLTLDTPLCEQDPCASDADRARDERQRQRELVRNVSLGLGIAALSGALWFTVSHNPQPGGHTTRLGFRPVSGGSVALVGGRF